MSGSSKTTNSSRRRAQITSSSVHQADARSKSDLDSKDALGSKRAHSQAQVGCARRNDFTTEHTSISIGDARGPDSGKLAVSRRRISSNLTPQASPRMRRKDGSEKENVKVEHTPRRPTDGRTTTSTLRRKPVPHIGLSPVKLKTLELVSRSQSLQPSQFSRASRLNLHARTTTLASQNAMAKTRSMVSLDVGVKKGDVFRIGRSHALSQPLLGSASIKTEGKTKNASVSQDIEAVEHGMPQHVITLDSSSKPDSSTVLRNVFSEPTIPSVSGSPSVPQPDSPSRPLEPLELQGISSSVPFQRPMTVSTPTSPLEQSSSSIKRLSTVSSLASLVDFAEDTEAIKKEETDLTKAVDKESTFGFVDLPPASQHPQQPEDAHTETLRTLPSKVQEYPEIDLEEIASTASSKPTASACFVELSEEAGFEAVLPPPSIHTEIEKSSVVHATLETEDIDECKAQVDVQVKDSEEASHLTPESELDYAEKAKPSSSKSENDESSAAQVLDHGSSNIEPSYTESTDTKNSDGQSISALEPNLTGTQSCSVPSTPPSTPVQTPSPSSSTPAPGAAPVSSLPPSLFPRLFTELASTYSQYGFAAFSAGSSISVPALDPQTARTQKELASLRAGKGSVLARARAFGQTLWSPSTARTRMQEVGDVSETKAKATSSDSDERNGSTLQVSNSGSVGTPPASPTVPTGGRRTLGCVDSLHAVAMAQRLWMTKNFELE